MTTSQTLIDKLKEFEGYRLKAYKPVPTEKFWTIGFGHYGPDVKQGQVITEQQAIELLRKDLAAFERSVNALNVCKTQGQFDALVDFAYNCGTANLQASTLLKKIRAGIDSPTLIADCRAVVHADRMKTMSRTQMFNAIVSFQFLRWNKAGGKVLAGLTKRRQWEAQRWAE